MKVNTRCDPQPLSSRTTWVLCSKHKLLWAAARWKLFIQSCSERRKKKSPDLTPALQKVNLTVLLPFNPVHSSLSYLTLITAGTLLGSVKEKLMRRMKYVITCSFASLDLKWTEMALCVCVCVKTQHREYCMDWDYITLATITRTPWSYAIKCWN